MKKSSRHETKQVTMAELCEALTNGTIRAQIKNGEYVIRHHDLARLAYADAPNDGDAVISALQGKLMTESAHPSASLEPMIDMACSPNSTVHQ